MSGLPSPPPGPAIAQWLARRAPIGSPWSVGAPMGDVSSRKYFRASSRRGSTLVVAWYPQQAAETYARYQRASRLLDDIGIRTPEIVALDDERRFMALEDAGDRRLFDLEPGPEVESLYEHAVEIAARIATLPRPMVAALNPPIDLALLRREVESTWELFLARRLPDTLHARVRDGLTTLCEAIAGIPLEPCHRDFMSRNLMVVGERAERELVVIDHQDLRLGPRGYDLASLLHDSCRLDTTQIARLEPEDSEAGTDAYHRLVAQRALKIIGTFHAFAERGTPTYLPMVPSTLDTAIDHLSRVSEHDELANCLREHLGSGSSRRGG